jgi:hypothetical protein
MRLMNALSVIGLAASAPAVLAQEPLRPYLDVPADYQPLRPLPTDWPRPSNRSYVPATRYTMGETGPNGLRVNALRRAERRLLELREMELRRMGIVPDVTGDAGRVTPADAPVDATAPASTARDSANSAAPEPSDQAPSDATTAADAAPSENAQ